MGIQKFKCHKTVEAFEIHTIVNFEQDSSIRIYAKDGSFVTVPESFINKHEVNKPGYLVIYQDGYKSFSPKAAFEAGYSLINEPENVSREKVPAVTDSEIEKEIKEKGLNAPRITPADVEENIESEWYINGATGVVPDSFQPAVPAGHPLELVTFCLLVLKNGFTVHGYSYCVSPENFDAEIGRKIARKNAVESIWPLMGYMLREKIHKGVFEELKDTEKLKRFCSN